MVLHTTRATLVRHFRRKIVLDSFSMGKDEVQVRGPPLACRQSARNEVENPRPPPKLPSPSPPPCSRLGAWRPGTKWDYPLWHTTCLWPLEIPCAPSGRCAKRGAGSCVSLPIRSVVRGGPHPRAALSLEGQFFFFFFLLRTAPRDHQPLPPSAANRQPPTANRRQLLPTANRQPPTANRQPFPQRRPHDQEAESVAVSVHFCWRNDFLFPLRTALSQGCVRTADSRRSPPPPP